MLSKRSVLFILFFPLVLGCSTLDPVKHIPKDETKDSPRKLVVFLDGTANDAGSYTNIAKLHNLATLQPNRDIKAIYIEGVGTKNRWIGMVMGWGIGYDVREAYQFLVENYNESRNDEIYIFGFSRGAYAARILSALIYVAGIPDLNMMDKEERKSHIKKIYGAYKSKKTLTERRDKVYEVIGVHPKPQDIEFLGLWDTIEALGLPDYRENTKEPNKRYLDQLCNIKEAAHALSLDDNRSRIFTPILLTHSKLTGSCPTPIEIDKIVDEVWFSGAHADVGGGYEETYISGVSLNWMLSKISKFNITPKNSEVYSDYLHKTHNPNSGKAGIAYKNQNRDLYHYAKNTNYNNQKLKLHTSVISRLKEIKPKHHEFHWKNSKFQNCFKFEDGKAIYQEKENCFTIVK